MSDHSWTRDRRPRRRAAVVIRRSRSAAAVVPDALQEQVFAFLADPASHGGASVHRIDTHGASVFLAGDRALKIKRAVRFPFLDYSTLAKRKAACQDELAINRAFAPKIYRRVVAITKGADGRFQIGGDGETLEWAVEMARFDETATIDHLAKAGPLPSGLAVKIAEVVAASHAAATVAATKPWIASIAAIIAGTTSAFRAGNTFAPDQIETLDRLCRAALARLLPLFEARGAQGLVRRCHGDLHLSNIVLIDHEPVLFDAIEFDPNMASIDVFYDLAFALMDFVHYGRRDEAATLLNRYLAITSKQNFEALSTLPLLMTMRAAIRANVMLARVARNSEDAAAIRQIAEDYFALALRLIAPPPPRLIAVGGLSGTGKSLLAKALAGSVVPEPGAVVLRSDVRRKQLFNVAEIQRLPEHAYRPDVTAEVYQLLAEHAARILAQGHSVIVDAVFAREDERDAIERVANHGNARFDGLYLVADLDTRIRRVSGRAGDASDATPEIVRRQDCYDAGAIRWTMIDASGTPEQTLQRANAGLASVIMSGGSI
jgi:aminoglycoside phosphotransferase family enzyme/predicted kinase